MTKKDTISIFLNESTLGFMDADRKGLSRDEYINKLIQQQIKQHIANAIKSTEKVNHNYR